ncbi:tRNA lysidine(34) synthetase TilS [Sphingomonas sp. ERG5]|uniref:tRNA lysidine(34) synthetase TilS n=1 Tax=Sphingomonas sp. ERG5 TaxID=1381597 RepID=UPI001F165464|nr:tRNA lysidine(34) synthetase TilS [Sphingomonas sp. ERG5]
MTLAAERIARAACDLAAALRRPVQPDDRLALAVSGGPDSMAMLALLATAFPGQVIAATVDHGLRPEGAAEAAMVAAYCATQDVPHAVLTLATAIGPANIQAAARDARYLALRGWATGAGATLLATAHHADDQAETFLMRAARGSGLSGLAAIRPAQRVGADPERGLMLVRPFLGWRRADLRRVAETWSLPFVDDPSNANARFDRTRFRTLLREAPWLDAGQIALSAGYLAEADHDLRALEQWLWVSRALPGDAETLRIDVTALPREVRRRLARIAIAKARAEMGISAPKWSPATNIEALLDALDAGKSATQGGVLASAKGGIWQFRVAPPRRTH